MIRQEQRGRRRDRRNVFIEKHITSKPPLEVESARTVYAMTLAIAVMVTKNDPSEDGEVVSKPPSNRQQPHPPAGVVRRYFRSLC